MSSMKGLCTAHQVAWVLVIVGALNWGLVGFFDWNLVESLLGAWPTVVSIVYGLVGVAALFSLACGSCKSCKR